MFTGLVETCGIIKGVRQTASGSTITIEAPDILEDVKLGDSIAIDGVCTTVITFDQTTFTIEASPETLSKTTFNTFKSGIKVNLERPLTPTSRIGGHYVTGHVDGLATLVSKTPEGISFVLTFELESDDLAQYVVAKGSIAIAGISLTVNTVSERQFTVAIIPHTMTKTNLGDRKIGDAVNIETDLLGKYVKKLLSPTLNQSAPSRIDEAFLAEHGFLPTA